MCTRLDNVNTCKIKQYIDLPCCTKSAIPVYVYPSHELSRCGVSDACIDTGEVLPLFQCSLHSQFYADKWYWECSANVRIVNLSVIFSYIYEQFFQKCYIISFSISFTDIVETPYLTCWVRKHYRYSCSNQGGRGFAEGLLLIASCQEGSSFVTAAPERRVGEGGLQIAFLNVWGFFYMSGNIQGSRIFEHHKHWLMGLKPPFCIYQKQIYSYFLV